jgi:hypothetical protein
MGASEKAVAAVMETLGCRKAPWGPGESCCRPEGKYHGVWTDRGCPVAVATADLAVDTDRPSIQAQALRDYASELDWKQPEKCPCKHPEHCCGSEASCDAMQPSTRVVGAINLRARADRIDAQP